MEKKRYRISPNNGTAGPSFKVLHQHTQRGILDYLMSGSKSQVFRKDTALWIQRQKSNRFSGYAIVHKLSRLYFSILHSPNQKDVHIHRRTPKTRFFTIREESARVCVCVCVCVCVYGVLEVCFFLCDLDHHLRNGAASL